MTDESSSVTVFAQDFPEARLFLKVLPTVSAPPEQDKEVQKLAHSMWGSNCHFGLVMTPAQTYVLRDDFKTWGPEAIHVSDVVSTAALLGRTGDPETPSNSHLTLLAHLWLQRLATSYEAALPEDPELQRVFFPDIVGAVAEGRVVSQVAAR